MLKLPVMFCEKNNPRFSQCFQLASMSPRVSVKITDNSIWLWISQLSLCAFRWLQPSACPILELDSEQQHWAFPSPSYSQAHIALWAQEGNSSQRISWGWGDGAESRGDLSTSWSPLQKSVIWLLSVVSFIHILCVNLSQLSSRGFQSQVHRADPPRTYVKAHGK